MIIDDVIYGVILRANIVKLLKDPPENKSNRSNSPASPWNMSANTLLLIFGTGIFEPILKTTSISRVKIILLLISAIFHACATVFNIPILNHLCLSSGSLNFFDRRLAELMSFNLYTLFKLAVSKDLNTVLSLLNNTCFLE